jgi:hypothetical protein
MDKKRQKQHGEESMKVTNYVYSTSSEEESKETNKEPEFACRTVATDETYKMSWPQVLVGNIDSNDAPRQIEITINNDCMESYNKEIKYSINQSLSMKDDISATSFTDSESENEFPPPSSDSSSMPTLSNHIPLSVSPYISNPFGYGLKDLD